MVMYIDTVCSALVHLYIVREEGLRLRAAHLLCEAGGVYLYNMSQRIYNTENSDL